MSSPRFSVVVPTRERAATLRSCLRTCLAQDFDDYEIIVCDNFSSPETAEVVNELAHPRLRYVRAPEPLAMSANWELALSHATGEYILLLGDDDGLLSHALREIDAIARRTGARAIRWSPAVYTWPNVALDGQANYLCLSLVRHLRERNGREAIRAVLESLDYSALPMLYTNAVVHREIIDKIRERAGRVFGCRSPDVYTAFAVAFLAETFVSVTVPFSISGLSGKSNGVACAIKGELNAISNDYHQLNAANSFAPHPWVPQVALFPITAVSESFYRARAAFFPEDPELDLPRKKLLERCVFYLRGKDETARAQCLAAIRASAVDDPEVLAWFDATYATVPAAGPEARVRPENLGSDGDNLHLDASAFGVVDVEGAANLVSRLLSLDGGEIRYDLRGRWDEIVELQRDVFESHRIIWEYRDMEAARLERERRRPINRLRRAVGRCVRFVTAPLPFKKAS